MLPIAAFPLLISQFVPFEAEVTNRLAMTPVLDGTIAEEEWDHLADFQGLRSYFQWQPGALFVAGDVQNGAWARILIDQDSAKKGLTPNAREWLVGRTASGLTVMVRKSNAESRKWERLPQEEALQQFAFSQQTERWQFELSTATLANLSRQGTGLRVRVEPVPMGIQQAGLGDMVSLRLVLDRGFGLPDGVKWSPRIPDRTVIPGDSIRMGMSVTSLLGWAPDQVTMRTVGAARLAAPEVRMPFPDFGRDNTAAFDYVANIHEDSPEGYTVLLTQITDENGGKAVLQSSYLIAPRLVIDHSRPEVYPQPDGSIRLFVDVLLRSKTRNSLRGRIKVSSPAGWQVVRGEDAPFIIYHSRGTARLRVELRGTPSSEPVTLPIEVRMGEWVSSQSVILRYQK